MTALHPNTNDMTTALRTSNSQYKNNIQNIQWIMNFK